LCLIFFFFVVKEVLVVYYFIPRFFVKCYHLHMAITIT